MTGTHSSRASWDFVSYLIDAASELRHTAENLSRWGFRCWSEKLGEKEGSLSAPPLKISTPLRATVCPLLEVISFTVPIDQAPQASDTYSRSHYVGFFPSTVPYLGMLNLQKRPPIHDTTPFLVSSCLLGKSSGYFKSLPDGAEDCRGPQMRTTSRAGRFEEL
jgi:hypothetical protein